MKSSNKILVIALVLLLIVNIGMLVYMLKGNRHGTVGRRPVGKEEVFRQMVKELNMTDKQQADYRKMKEEHFKNIRPIFDSIRSLKQSLFSLVNADTINDSLVANYSGRIAEQQAIADKATINHFRSVRALFTGTQRDQFDTFIQKMMQRRRGGGKDSADRK